MSSTEAYNPDQAYNDLQSYNDYMGTMSAEQSSPWMLMCLIGYMVSYDNALLGADAETYQGLQEILGEVDELNQDLNAGNSTYVDNQGNYVVTIGDETYYTQTDAKVDGQTVPYDQTLNSKIEADSAKLEADVKANPYFQDNPELMDQFLRDIDDFNMQIEQYDSKGGVQAMWEETDPQHFDEDSTAEGNASVMQPVTDDIGAMESQCSGASSAMEAIMKELVQLIQTEEDTMDKEDESMCTQINTINANMQSQG